MKKKHIYNYDYLNQIIKDHLKDNVLTMTELAKSIDMTERNLKKSLNNKRDFYVSEIYKLSEVLNLDQEELKKAFFNCKLSSEEKSINVK